MNRGIRTWSASIALLAGSLAVAGTMIDEDVSLLDDAWTTDLLINDVTFEPAGKTPDPTAVKSGEASAKLANVASPAGWPNVRFVAGDHLLGAIQSGVSTVRLSYRTDAWDGSWEIQLWAYLGQGEPVLLATSEASPALQADNQWHDLSLKLTLNPEQAGKLSRDQRYPTYVWFIPKSGWGKTHTTYVDDVRLSFD